MILTFFKISKRCLGIDIGTSFVKIVEISGSKEKKKLENYGEISSLVLYKRPFRAFEKNNFLLSSQDIAKVISAILKEAKIRTKKVIFSIPDFCSFFTSFELPLMSKKELPQAVRYEARQHVPLPLGEVVLDWQVINKEKELKILLIAVPNDIITQYQEIATLCALELFAIEAEVFGLLRALIKEKQGTIILIDIGSQSTTCSVIDNQILRISHSFDTAGNELTEQIVKELDIDYKTAEFFKKKYGTSMPNLDLLDKKSIKEILLPSINSILVEVKKISQEFYHSQGKEIQKIILAGGTALLPGLKEYFEDQLKTKTEIANPFSNISYPSILEKTLNQMGPSYAIAIGMALRGLE